MAHIFVFGSNSTGFHGAGSAGHAFRNESANTWRTDHTFLAAMQAPVGHPSRIGHLAVFGIARGLQHGHHGSSWAIQTIERPGQRRSTPLPTILAQVQDLLTYALAHPSDTFTITPIGTGYSGYTVEEMEEHVWSRVSLPSNCTRLSPSTIAFT